MTPSTTPSRPGLTRVQWLICTIAAIGFAFDIYELLMLPLIVRPALMELGGIAPGTPEFAMWVGRLFFIPAFAGGLFGLIGGVLTDRLGRRRVLTASILLYAGSAFAAGYSTSIEMLLVFRCGVFIGVCVEFVAAVAWLAELFDDPKQREKVLGYTQAFSSIGGLLVAVMNGLCVAHAAGLPMIHLPDWMPFQGDAGIKDPHAAWRYTLMSGLIPALPLLIIRPFLPESPRWVARKQAGQLGRPRIRQLFTPELRRVTVVTTLLFACSYGAAFGAIQMVPQIVPGLSQVKEQVALETADLAGPERLKAQKQIEQARAASFTKVQEVGGLVGRLLLAVLVVRLLGWGRLLRCFLLPGLLLMPLLFATVATHNPTLLELGGVTITLLHVGIFLAGLVTVGQFSFWGNYLPHAFPLHLRGTGEGFAANIGGRMLGTSFAWVTSTLAVQEYMPGDNAPAKVAYAAAFVAAFVYVLANILVFFLPEPAGTDLG